jgi:hypothetical protein
VDFVGDVTLEAADDFPRASTRSILTDSFTHYLQKWTPPEMRPS